MVNVDFQIRELASIAYSRCGRAIEQYSGIMSALDRSENERRSININRLVAFAAPRQCADEANVLSRGTPRSEIE